MRTYKFRLINEDTGEKQVFTVQDCVFAGAATKAYIERSKKGFGQRWKIDALWHVKDAVEENEV